MENKFYDSFISNIKSKKDKNFLEKQEIYNLYKRPPKENKNESSNISAFEDNQIHQADLLFLPDDRGFKYCLVVVDCSSHLTDAEGIKTKTADEALHAIIKIYKRGSLNSLHIKYKQIQARNSREYLKIILRTEE